MNPFMKKWLVHIAEIIGLTVLALSFALSFVVAQEQSASFNGVWERNDDESDDPQEKMKEAMQAMRSQMGDRGGMGGPPGRGGERGGRSGGRGGRQGGFAQLVSMTREIETVLNSGEFHVIPSDEGKVQIFYLDGKKHKRETANGAELETKSEKKGNRIIVEQKMDRGEMNTTYELAPDGTRMIVTTRFEGGRMKEPIIIRAVYDLISDEAAF